MQEKSHTPISRRGLARTAAWGAPLLLATTQIPAYAASSRNPSTTFRLLALPEETDQDPQIAEPILGLWFTPPIDSVTKADLGGTATIKAGAQFVLTITQTFKDGVPPVPPANWEDGSTYSYEPFGTPGAAGSYFNSAHIAVAMGTGQVEGQMWTGTATFTTMTDTVATGGAEAGAQLFFPRQHFGFNREDLLFASIQLRTTVGTISIAPATGSASTVDLKNKSVISFIGGYELDSPVDEPGDDAEAPVEEAPAEEPEAAPQAG